MQKELDVNSTENVYCPICRQNVGRNKLLFKKSPGAKGKVKIVCRGCKNEVEIDLESK